MKEKIYCIIEYGIKAKRIYDKTHISAYSAQAAFFVLVSAVPLAMAVFIVTGALVPQMTEKLAHAAGAFFTQQAGVWVTGFLQEMQLMATVPVASVTMIFLVWTATRGIRSIADGISAIYRCEREYSPLQRLLRSVAYAFVLMAVVWLSLLAEVVAGQMKEKLVSALGGHRQIAGVLLNSRGIIVFSALVLLFAFAYKNLARSDIPTRNHLAGAVVAAAGWMVYSFGYSVYIRHFSKYSLLYGSLGAVMLFMLWLYMCMNILLCGALLGRLLTDRNKCD